MSVYENMWNDFKQRLINAQTWSVNKSVTYQEILQLILAYEEEFSGSIIAESEADALEKVEEIENKKKLSKKDEPGYDSPGVWM